MQQRSTAASQAENRPPCRAQSLAAGGSRRLRNPQIIDEQPGPVVSAGHSYSGAVITEAAGHEKVAAGLHRGVRAGCRTGDRDAVAVVGAPTKC